MEILSGAPVLMSPEDPRCCPAWGSSQHRGSGLSHAPSPCRSRLYPLTYRGAGEHEGKLSDSPGSNPAPELSELGKLLSASVLVKPERDICLWRQNEQGLASSKLENVSAVSFL